MKLHQIPYFVEFFSQQRREGLVDAGIQQRIFTIRRQLQLFVDFGEYAGEKESLPGKES